MAGKAGKGFYGVEILTDTEKLTKLAKTLRGVSNGKDLRRDLLRNLRAAVQPGVQDVRAKLSGIAGGDASPALGGYLAGRVTTQVRLGGKNVGVRVRIPTTPQLRGFKMAAKRLNQKSWRKKNWRGKWIVQVSPIPGFFDETLFGRRAEYRAAVLAAVEKMARRLGTRL